VLRVRVKLSSLRRREEGQALVELALALPLLLLILFGLVDFGRAMNYWNDETNLANLAARVASVGKLPTSGTCSGSATITAYVNCQALIDSPELANNLTVYVCATDPTNSTNTASVTVKVSDPFSWLPFVKSAVGSPTTTLSGRATMRQENATTLYTDTTTTNCA
jgi:Flp pilus assembly protein TadG